MTTAHIVNVEILEETIDYYQNLHESLTDECNQSINNAKQEVDKASEEVKNSQILLRECIQEEQAAIRELNAAQLELSNNLSWLSSAEMALSICEATPPDDEGGPDCSVEAAEVARAASAVSASQERVYQAQIELEKATSRRIEAEQRLDLAMQVLNMAENLFESVNYTCQTKIQNSEANLENLKVRLNNAIYALNKYLKEDPVHQDIYSWLNWKPDANKVITPDDLNSRLKMSGDKLEKFVEYLYHNDKSFHNKVVEYRKQYSEAKSDFERDKILIKLTQNMSGLIGEKIVEYAFKPLGGHVETQSRTYFEDGRYTKTDLIITDLNNNVILGKGKGMGASKGGSIAIEVKCGKGEYIYSQTEHMVFQAGGHQESDASVTICTRDIKTLSEDKENEVRDKLREAGSPLIGILPKKEKIDNACWVVVTDNSEEKIEN